MAFEQPGGICFPCSALDAERLQCDGCLIGEVNKERAAVSVLIGGV
jgi:hypothetical protein